MREQLWGRLRCPVAALAAVALLAVVAVGINALTASGGRPANGPLRVTRSSSQPPGAFVRANGVFDLGGRAHADLGARVSGALTGPLSPVAVSSPDGRYVAYSSWFAPREIDNSRSFSKQGIRPGDVLGTPALRLYDSRTGTDSMLEHGAYSVAWRADGTLAFVRGVSPRLRAGSDFLGEIVVRDSLRGPTKQWTSEPGRYVVYGWAGTRLVAYRIGQGEELELLVLNGPGQVRSLGAADIVALSPDGTRVFVVARDRRHLRVLRLADGSEAAQLDLSETNPPLEWAAYSGAWSNGRVVAPVSAGLAVFDVDAETIALEQVLSLDRDAYPAGMQEPRFADDQGNEIVATVDLPPRGPEPAQTFFLDCDRVARTCERGDSAPARDWLRLVGNPSRPLKGGE
ncbi:MAG: hypothetical protein WBB74_03530 [Gaiellaceae bacterium]